MIDTRYFTLLIGSASRALKVYPVKFRFESTSVHRSFQPVALNPPKDSLSDKNLLIQLSKLIVRETKFNDNYSGTPQTI